ncbi:MAG: hypothetical protein IJ719_16605 [Clostridia bacterium]|nr:hypothetical protein [Clostridia bacterium]
MAYWFILRSFTPRWRRLLFILWGCCDAGNCSGICKSNDCFNCLYS